MVDSLKNDDNKRFLVFNFLLWCIICTSAKSLTVELRTVFGQ